VSLAETEKARELYERLLERTLHFKVWMSYAQFEMSSGDGDSLILARRVFERANQCLRKAGEKEERVKLLETWKVFEQEYGDEDGLVKVQNILPKRVKKRVHYRDGNDEGWEEMLDYVFPEDEAAKPNLKLLEKAKAWKKQMEGKS